MTRYGTNSGHGHVWERPDGMKARCGGPMMCAECAKDYAEFAAQQMPLGDSEGKATSAGAAPLPADVAQMVERLQAWSRDERLGDGMLLRRAADLLLAQQAEIERLTKERDAYQQASELFADELKRLRQQLAERNKDNDELVKMVLDQTQEIVNLRFQLSAAVTHGAELMRGLEGWQPIETAPKDGTDILVMYMHIDTQIVHNAFWNEYEDCDDSETGWWSYEHSEVSRIKLDDWMTPTHWMPLPAAPKPGEKE